MLVMLPFSLPCRVTPDGGQDDPKKPAVRKDKRGNPFEFLELLMVGEYGGRVGG